MSMHRLFAEQLRCATDASGRVDVVKLGELVSAAYAASERDRQRMITRRGASCRRTSSFRLPRRTG
ncbi:hypothetical protein [Bradyrhizobium iriomotense]|uniref:hypothetical protein n=1 Tax=Bradyrhizobium iriomotense TaxID=441950 RepID=UPI001B8A6069|nr:hypothetical protein [Bradyrhizobium iriomotense]MBR1127535.1 hypothetical protein [Bradyrhizobium iriomotense]